MIVKVLIAPRRYVQGAGVLADIGKYLAPLANAPCWSGIQTIESLFAEEVIASLKGHEVEPMSFVFSGECDRGQIAKGIEMVKAQNADVVVGIGGGKAIDLAKAVAWCGGARSSPCLRLPAMTPQPAHLPSTTPKMASWMGGVVGRATPTWCWWIQK